MADIMRRDVRILDDCPERPVLIFGTCLTWDETESLERDLRRTLDAHGTGAVRCCGCGIPLSDPEVRICRDGSERVVCKACAPTLERLLRAMMGARTEAAE